MTTQVGLIGFGEAGQAFAGSSGWTARASAYDKLTNDPYRRAAKLADYASCSVSGAERLAQALEGASIVLSLVTPGEALAAARGAAPLIAQGALYVDMNSVSPDTKRAAAEAIAEGGGRYVDVAVMSPVSPARLAVPLLVSGPDSIEAERALRGIGFQNIRSIGARVGSASAIKMIRSVLVKGIEALTAEAMCAAFEAGVVEEVIGSLDASERALPWATRANYNLDRMMVHGTRRAEEMEEAVRTLEDLGVDPALSRATVCRQRALGALKISPDVSLEAKLAQLCPGKADAA